MRSTRSAPILLGALALAAACAAPGASGRADAPRPAGAPPAGPWASAAGRDHPLVGRIWDVEAGRFVEPRVLAGRLAAARFVLLGEQHDNPDHHRLQAWVLRSLVAAGRRPAVAFEMLAEDQAPALARHLARAPGDAAGLGAAVGWEQAGWPPWRLYLPIAEAALAAGLPIVAADLPASTAARLARGGLPALEPSLVARLGLDRPLDEATRSAMAREIREAHCGWAPEARLDAMVAVQRARDAWMAARLAAAEADGAVLVAGAGHVRRDRGVPAALERRRPGARVHSIAFLEVRAGADDPAAYAERFGGHLPFHAVWFTPRVDDLDPCRKFQRALERLRTPGRSEEP